MTARRILFAVLAAFGSLVLVLGSIFLVFAETGVPAGLAPTATGFELAANPTPADCTPLEEWTQVYTIQPGDTFYSIAGSYGLSPSILAAGNCLTNPNQIVVGQQLRVPDLTVPSSTSTSKPSETPTPTPTPTPSPTASATGTLPPSSTPTQTELAATSIVNQTEQPASQTPKHTKTPTPYPTLISCTPNYNWVYFYTVQPGDTLYHIASMYGITANQLATANCINVRAYIYPGQQLRVPYAAPINPPTNTPKPPTKTPKPTSTSGPSPTATNTEQPTSGVTVIPQNTITATPVTPSATPVPPTDTATSPPPTATDTAPPPSDTAPPPSDTPETPSPIP